MWRTMARLWLGLAVLGGTAAAAAAGDDAADAVLKQKGLKRSGSAFVLPAEGEVQKLLNQARKMYQAIAATAAARAEFEGDREAVKAEIEAMEQERVLLNQQLSQVTTAEQNNRLVGAINALEGQIDAYRRRLSEAESGQGRAQNKLLASQREAFIEAVLDLRQRVDKALAAYAELAKDEDLKKAVAAVGRTTKARLALGPSRSFTANVKSLEKIEASVLTESVAMHDENGVHLVDVTLNGKVTRPMVFDTGASSIVLPFALAQEIGVKPGEGSPTVKAQVADGSIVEAKKAVIPTVRVGKFVVKDVECLVMPPDKANVPPLLGQTFHRHFDYKFSADAGTLVLSKIDTPDGQGQTPAAKTKAPGRSARNKRSGRAARPAAPSAGPE
jgi:aspartyl protease family protein